MRWWSASLRFNSARRVAARERSMKNFAITASTNIGSRINASAAPMPMRYMSPVTLWRMRSRNSGGSGSTAGGAGGAGIASREAIGPTGGGGTLGFLPDFGGGGGGDVSTLPSIVTPAFSPGSASPMSTSTSGFSELPDMPILRRLRGLDAAASASTRAWASPADLIA